MNPSPPTAAFLTQQVRWVMGRGIPAQEAEDLVVAAWEKASDRFDAARGDFEPFLARVIRNDAAYWWRTTARTERMHAQLRLVTEPATRAGLQQAAERQDALLEALSVDEQRIFHTWALQKHLGRAEMPAERASRSLAMSTPDYENAKRRLKAKLHRVLEHLGWSAAEVLHGDADVERTG